MDDRNIVKGLIVDDNNTISFFEVCEQCHISENWLIEILEQGLVEHAEKNLHAIKFDSRLCNRIQKAHHLQQDLDINPAGAVLVLELLDELADLRTEVGILRRYLDV